MPVFAFMMPGPMELGIVLLIVLMLFGAGKLPRVFGELGKGLKLLRQTSEYKDE